MATNDPRSTGSGASSKRPATTSGTTRGESAARSERGGRARKTPLTGVIIGALLLLLAIAAVVALLLLNANDDEDDPGIDLEDDENQNALVVEWPAVA